MHNDSREEGEAITSERYPQTRVAEQPSTGGRLLRMLRGGVAGNARLTALTGLLIFVLLAAEGVTILSIRALFTPHAFIGILLIPPISLKLASTGYRFISYYTRNPRYRIAGPPGPISRTLAPFLVITTIALFATGIILLFQGPRSGDMWRTLHTVSFFVWFWLMSAHVLTYLPRALSLAGADMVKTRAAAIRGTLDRRSLVAGSLMLGVVLAVVFLPWDATWAHWLTAFRHDN